MLNNYVASGYVARISEIMKNNGKKLAYGSLAINRPGPDSVPNYIPFRVRGQQAETLVSACCPNGEFKSCRLILNGFINTWNEETSVYGVNEDGEEIEDAELTFKLEGSEWSISPKNKVITKFLVDVNFLEILTPKVGGKTDEKTKKKTNNIKGSNPFIKSKSSKPKIKNKKISTVIAGEDIPVD